MEKLQSGRCSVFLLENPTRLIQKKENYLNNSHSCRRDTRTQLLHVKMIWTLLVVSRSLQKLPTGLCIYAVILYLVPRIRRVWTVFHRHATRSFETKTSIDTLMFRVICCVIFKYMDHEYNGKNTECNHTPKPVFYLLYVYKRGFVTTTSLTSIKATGKEFWSGAFLFLFFVFPIK